MKLQLLILLIAFVAIATSFKLNNRVALCSECMEYIESLSTKTFDNEDECREKAEKMCELLSLPQLMDKKCREHVLEEMGKIVQSIKDKKSGREICTNFGLCRAQ